MWFERDRWNRFGIDDTVRKQGMTDAPDAKSPEQLDELRAEILNMGEKFIAEHDWKSLANLVESLPDNDSIVTQTDIMKDFYELMLEVPVREDEYYWDTRWDGGEGYDYEFDDGTGWRTIEAVGAIVKKMGNNRALFPYLLQLAQTDRIPLVMIKEGDAEIIRAQNAGGEPDDDARWFYYKDLCDGLLRQKEPESFVAVDGILKKIDKQIFIATEQQRKYGLPDPTPEDLAQYPDQYLGFGRPEYTPEDMFQDQRRYAESGWNSDWIAGIFSNQLAVNSKSEIIHHLQETRNNLALPVLLDLIKREGSDAPIYFNPVLEALKGLDQKQVAENLLQMAKSTDQFEKRSALWLLYRLELGKIGISEQGVKYLGRLYDIGEYNNPKFSAARLTPEGEVGVFDDSERLQGYFELGDLTDGQKVVSVNVLEITERLLFTTEPIDEQDRIRRREVLEEFRSHYANYYKSDFFAQAGLHINNFSFAEQGWLFHFHNISGEVEKEKLASFARRYGESGLRTFLSLELDDDMGAKILQIGETLPQKEARIVFDKYGGYLDSMGRTADYICAVYRNVFSENFLTRDQVLATLLIRGNSLLASASQALEGTAKEEQGRVVNSLIKNFDYQEKAQNTTFMEFQAAAQDLRFEIEKTDLMLFQDTENHGRFFGRDAAVQEDVESEIKAGRITPEQVAITEERRPKRVTSEKIQVQIELLQKKLDEFPEAYRIMKQVEESGEANPGLADAYKLQFEEETRPAYESYIRTMGALAKFQARFEAKFQALLTGSEQAVLKNTFFNDFEKTVAEPKPESLPKAEPVYFPVGISKDMPRWQEVLEGKTKASKPIDIYAYLFWLNNQARQVELVVADEVQAFNYQTLYNQTEEDALKVALAAGEQDRKFYEQVITTFGLSNLHVASYREFKQPIQEKFDRYMELCREWVKHPALAGAFGALVSESVQQNEATVWQSKLLDYGLDEVALILAASGTKISHRNEARYDVMASLLRAAEDYAARLNIPLFKIDEQTGQQRPVTFLEDSRLQVVLLTVADGLREYLNTQKGVAERAGGKDSEAYIYAYNAYEQYEIIKKSLKDARKDSVTTKGVGFSSKSIKYNFACPNVTSQSIGWRSQGAKGEQSVVRFREPYSTYFYHDGAEVFLNSDQVVAVPEGLITGKVLALDSQTQQNYAEKVIRPLLVQYFKTLESAPQSYFDTIGKTIGQLSEDIKNASTVTDLLRFVQEYVVKPSVAQEA